MKKHQLQTHHPLVFILILTLFSINWSCTTDSKSASYDISISWELISNVLGDDVGCRAAFTIKNEGSSTLGNTGWTLYYNQTNRKILASKGAATVEQIKGDFYKLTPNEEFNLLPGESTTITYDLTAWLIKENDAPHGLYLAFENDEGEVISKQKIDNYTIEPFTKADQLNRHKVDHHIIPTPETRYEANSKLSLLEEKDLLKIIPSPTDIQNREGSLSLTKDFKIYYQKDLKREANFLQETLEDLMLQKLELVEFSSSANIETKSIQLSTNNMDVEEYQLEVSEHNIYIEGGSAAGVFYGIQSLRALLPVDAYQNTEESLKIGQTKVVDGPRFPYRGMHLDIARNFQNKSAIIKLIDAMAYYKLNKLHLHLTEDEGWRLEIKALPELTEIGAFRGHTLNDEQHIQPAYGSGAETDPKASNGSGYLSQEEFIEILKYSQERHIEVIPEINVPGHARAAIMAMNARYKKLKSEGKEEAAAEFLLVDPDDQSEYESVQHYPDNVVCPCMESVYHFYETVVEELIQMYEQADVPFKTLHTGGDEVPNGVWEKSPICKTFLEANPDIKTPYDLTYYFRARLSEILSNRQLVMAGWEEIALERQESGRYVPNPTFNYGDNDTEHTKFLPYVWNNLWGNQDLGNRLANAGYDVVLCNVTNLYFDLAYDKDPKEPGFYWGGFVDTKKAWEFLPFDVFQSTKEDALGKPFDPKKDFAGMDGLTKEGKKNIVGIQGQLWSETIKGSDMLEYYYFPKMIGLAERAWSKLPEWSTIEDEVEREEAEMESWNLFANTIGQKELPRLDYISGGYNYRIPPPGVKIENGKVLANSAFPGLTIRYETEGLEATESSKEYNQLLEKKGAMKLKSFNTKGRGSRNSIVKE